jgi:phosphohistidine phosphatase SixA
MISWYDSMEALFRSTHYRQRPLKRGWLILLVVALTLIHAAPGFSSDNDTELWNSLRFGNSLVLIRHAIATGTGDPNHFKLGDCSTQRNLSAAGRAQAQAIGRQFRAHGIKKARVFSSQWCRCMETAELLELGPVTELPELNSFFKQYERRDVQTQHLKKWLKRATFDHPLVLVTHQVNITALTDFYPASGEMVIVKRSDSGEILVLGSIKTD